MEQRSLNENHLLVPFSVAEGHFTSWFCGNANSIHINKGGCTMDIGGVLSRAWQIIWRHKVLWIFGILASCGGNANGGASSNYSVSDRQELPPQMQPFFDRFATLTDWQIALLVGTVILVVLLLVVLRSEER